MIFLWSSSIFKDASCPFFCILPGHDFLPKPDNAMSGFGPTIVICHKSPVKNVQSTVN